MKFRQALFSSCSCLSLIGAIAICTMYAFQSYETEAEFVGGAVGALCWSFVPFLACGFFALLAWRNAAGAKTQKRHDEMIATIQMRAMKDDNNVS